MEMILSWKEKKEGGMEGWKEEKDRKKYGKWSLSATGIFKEYAPSIFFELLLSVCLLGPWIWAYLPFSMFRGIVNFQLSHNSQKVAHLA